MMRILIYTLVSIAMVCCSHERSTNSDSEKSDQGRLISLEENKSISEDSLTEDRRIIMKFYKKLVSYDSISIKEYVRLFGDWTIEEEEYYFLEDCMGVKESNICNQLSKDHLNNFNSKSWMACEVLVCAMPYSHYVYVEALRSQQQPEFIKGLAHALHYLGGVPQSIKCDNMKTAVIRAHRYEPSFTEAMEYLAAHYDTSILAARVRKPRDKPSVEKAVDLAYKNIYAPLRDQIFYSLEELNAAIGKQLEVFNSQPFKVKAGSRRQLFEAEEKPRLKALPSSPYLIKNVTQSKVQRNYHVILGVDRHQYSVPYTLIGKRLKVIYTTDTVEVYDNLQRVAMHKRSYKKNGYTTVAEHMPPNHRHVAQQRGWDDGYFLREASYRGQAVQEVVKKILASRAFYEQTYNSCGHPSLRQTVWQSKTGSGLPACPWCAPGKLWYDRQYFKKEPGPVS